ncbi:MAG TPA: lipid-A-disaccharide synthase, partial [Hyphomicrobiaceae bacterium]|nr:lipid-A-disaccharide synthase [Hyphomicrobiaceae bacterium]
IEKFDHIRGLDLEPLRARLDARPGQPILVVLPGSRQSEIARMMDPFGATLTVLRERGVTPVVVVPVVESIRDEIEARAAAWPIAPVYITGEDDKFRAFRLADAALATSGTVTLELALAGTPMVVGYKVDRVGAMVRPFLKTPSVVLANLVLGRNVFAEFLQEECTGPAFAERLLPLLSDTPERRNQLAALAEIPSRLDVGAEPPSMAAARIVLKCAEAAGQPKS